MQNVLADEFYIKESFFFFSLSKSKTRNFLGKLQKVLKNKAFCPVLDVEQSVYPFTYKNFSARRQFLRTSFEPTLQQWVLTLITITTTNQTTVSFYTWLRQESRACQIFWLVFLIGYFGQGLQLSLRSQFKVWTEYDEQTTQTKLSKLGTHLEK